MKRASQFGIILVVIVVPVLLLSVYVSFFDRKPLTGISERSGGKITIRIERTPIAVDIADTLDERIEGLSGRESLGESEGLLFIFEASGRHGIWMKDMNFPIDIIWVGDDLTVVDIKRNATPESFPTVFYPREDARYVVEVNALFTEIHDIQIGGQVTIPQSVLE
jgi:hypothetical protein